MSKTAEKQIELPASLTVRELAQQVQASPIDIIKILMTNGVMANINQMIDYDTAAIIVSELGFEVTQEKTEQEEVVDTGTIPYWRQLIMNEKPKDLVDRAPVITILGHVDHGKTTLLDAIRKSDVAGGEFGGITQHIGAYQIEHKGKPITFLDTPGHAAFTAMRARGAQGADIVVLVVAANDGVMPQTKEAINHATAAKVPIIVALNKIDLDDANPEFTKRQLSEMGLVPDEWGGNTMVVPVSAKAKIGLDDLLEAILLVADSNEIKANPNSVAVGTVIEAEIEKAKGVLATLLVQNGTLQSGDFIVAGLSSGKIRAMFDFRGKPVRKAGPSTPVRVMGLSDVPHAGDFFQVFKDEKVGRQAVQKRKAAELDKRPTSAKASLEEMFANFQAGKARELQLIVKADVEGSLEPIVESLRDIKSDEIKINILHAQTGNISEGDVILASASNAIIIGFNVKADAAARKLAETERISIRLYNIIYRLIEDVEKALKGLLEPEYEQVDIGKAEVLAIFSISKVGNIAGCKVIQGEIRRNARVRVTRKGELIYETEVSSLRHEKEVVREVRQGFECGISLRNFDEFQPGDMIEAYVVEEKKF
jgi:translation initiation factor IF-2